MTFRRKLCFSFLPWVIPSFFLAAWWLLSSSGWLPAYLLPSPEKVLSSFGIYIFGTPGSAPYAGRFRADLTASLLRVGVGFLLSVVLGLPLGVLSGRSPFFQRFLSVSVDGLRAVPGISWLPLAIVWFGIGMGTTVFLVALAAFFPVYLNTAIGVQNVSPLLLNAGAMLGIGPVRSLWAVLLPAAMPQIIAGLRLALGVSWAYLVLGELTGVPQGLGAVIMDARMLGRIDIIIVGITVIAAMGRLSDWLLIVLMRLLFRSARRMA